MVTQTDQKVGRFYRWE